MLLWGGFGIAVLSTVQCFTWAASIYWLVRHTQGGPFGPSSIRIVTPGLVELILPVGDFRKPPGW